MRLFYILVLLLCGCSFFERTENSPRVEVYFSALWWSEKQIEALDLKQPPPKETRIKLTEWKYQDPIHDKHPNQVFPTVEISNKTGQPLRKVEIESKLRYRVGPYLDERLSKWEAFKKLTPKKISRLAHRDTQAIEYQALDLKALQNELFKKKHWPWRIELTTAVFTRQNDERTYLGETTTLLRLTPPR